MPGKRRKVAWITGSIVLAVLVVAFLVIRHHRQPITITGAVTIQDGDFRKQLPISDVQVSLAGGTSDSVTKTDASGFFSITLHRWVHKGHPITLKFRHPNYQPLNLTETADNRLYLAHLVPVVKKAPSVATTTIGNVRIRYLTKGLRTINVGSAAQTFEVLNTGNTPCNRQAPCSPDGKWKASIGSTTLDAGPGNEFHNARVSCIAGPCPFTKIESEDLRPSQKITAWASNWSDNATFLVEAEVVHVMQSVTDHQSYPVIFGSEMSFTLPSDAEGVTLEADTGGETIIYPLGPKLLLSWASCDATQNRERTNMYRCELKPGYRFQ